jgi:hypothetical protein
MAITKLTKHDSHRVTVRLTLPQHPHHAEIRCVDCDKHIQWLSKTDYQQLQGAQNNGR